MCQVAAWNILHDRRSPLWGPYPMPYVPPCALNVTVSPIWQLPHAVAAPCASTAPVPSVNTMVPSAGPCMHEQQLQSLT